ncbi:MAG: hypothetical protein AMR96_04205 [Candidatus Adiutrix intracellularis]|jgi:membrane protein implicated in regulation of membrane protease activity|nr:MAG: hypothetical protein AMR96_04205 [Candidatus Adiutrix intracellularis]MDR2827293.1 NfeD family protein [Candidatus Adiutrix intracellularis]
MKIFGLNVVLLWFGLGTGLLLLEVLTPGFFFIFFGLGAMVTCTVVSFTSLNQTLQWLLFIVVSVLSFLIFRRKLKNLFGAPADRVDPVTNEVYLSQEVLVIREIAPGQPGLVELNGTNWQAACVTGLFRPGDRVKVISMSGLTLTVEPLFKESLNV